MKYPKNSYDNHKNIPIIINNFDIKSESAATLIKEDNSKIILNSQTEVIFNATNSNKSQRKRNIVPSSRGKLKKYTRVVRIQKMHLKRKRHGSNINKNLTTCCKNEKTNYTNQKLLHRLFCSNSLSKTVSRTRVLKKVLAKENLLEDKHTPDIISSESGSSQDTLTRKNSESSNNDDNNTRTFNSVIEIPLIDQISIPNVIQIEENGELKSKSSHGNKTNLYKTDVMNVAVAQINNASILTNDFNNERTATGTHQILRQSLTSAESFESQSDTITSTSFLESSKEDSEVYLNNITLKEDRKSSVTLIGGSILASESDNFFIAKASSYFKEQCNSDKTLAREPLNDIIKPVTVVISSQDLKPTLLDTIINMGMFPMAPGNESANVRNDLNNVIVTGKNKKLHMSRLEDTINGKISKNVTQKTFSTDDSNNPHIIILPNENTIKEILTETEMSQKKTCSEESRNYAPVTELWEKIAQFLDITMRRMEESLIEKIRHELKDVVSKFEHFSPISEPKTKSQPKIYELDQIEIGHPKSLDENLQCRLIQNEIIDELLIKINNKELKCLAKEKNEYSLEIIKPPIPCTSIVRGQDSITMERFKNRTLSKYRFFSLPFRFIRENMLVIVSAPLFCFTLFLIYSFLVILKIIW
ncbi:unnamed protein product, partial [Brenthis ino]